MENELKRRYLEMCEAMKTLMRDEMMEAQREGEAIGEMKAKQETAFELYNRKTPVETIAEIIKVSPEIIKGWLSKKPSV